MHAADIVKALDLQPHPEGGYFRETYRASEAIPIAGLDRRYGGARATSTAIYYLLEAGQRSALHRLKSDEIFHFYTGDPLTIIEIAPDGRFTETLLGADFAAGAVPQHVIPAGTWFGAVPTGRFSSRGFSSRGFSPRGFSPRGFSPRGFSPRGFSPRGFSLVGCTVAPGFDFADFELAETAVLLAAFPQHETWIRRLT